MKSSSVEKIDDVGERLAGARKNMCKEMTMSLANITEVALTENRSVRCIKSRI